MTEQFVLDGIQKEMSTLTGHLGFYYKNLITGYEYGIGEEEIYGAASVIKFPLFLHILGECERGNLSLDDRIVTLESDKVPSCGALNMFTGDVETDIRTMCRLMICLSDNTATNRLIRLCGFEAIEQGFAQMGLEKTRIRRKLFDRSAAAAGKQNTISPKELGLLLERLWRGEFICREVSDYAIEVLSEQQIMHKLGGKLGENIKIAHKTGEDDGLSNDIGIVYADQPFVVCFTGHDTDVYPWEDLMRRAAYDLYCANSTSLDK
ncbi:MAG: serine hydrolase [Ruminococcaceae bacterium]|nr:serine hydrolase [Oscillospiraceae bacterium]